MAIQINGTTVIDNSRNITNVQGYYGNGVATKAEAEAGTNNNQLMTPLRVKQAIDVGDVSVIKRIQRGSTTVTTTGTFVPWFGSSSSLTGNSPSATVNAPITSVSTVKAFISQGVRGKVSGIIGRGSGVGDGLIMDGDNASARLTSSSNVAVTSGQGKPGINDDPFGGNRPPLIISATVDWEVIEFT